MVKNKIPAQELDRILNNALLFSDKKAMNLDQILLSFEDSRITSYSCDDYVAVSDSYIINFHLNPLYLSIENAEALSEWIKADKKVVHKYDIILHQKMTGVTFECEETSEDDESDSIFCPNSDKHGNWDVVFKILDASLNPKLILDFAVRPERLSKLWRLKADKEAPIHLRGVELKDKLLLQFKKGDTLLGAIMPVDLSYVKEEFKW